MGNIGNAHAAVYEEHPDCKIVAVCDIIKERTDRAAERYGCPGFYSVNELLSGGFEIDAASLCTAGFENGGDHYIPTIELLSAGIPVLGEKPISNEIVKAEEMVALAKTKNVRYGINLNHRFTPAAQRAQEWMTSGRLGEVNIINMTMWRDIVKCCGLRPRRRRKSVGCERISCHRLALKGTSRSGHSGTDIVMNYVLERMFCVPRGSNKGLFAVFHHEMQPIACKVLLST